jgi:hypothetical protein
MTFRTSLLLAAGLLVSACSPGGTLVISGFFPPTTTCGLPTGTPVQEAAGLLDVSPGSAEFWIVPQVYTLLVGAGNTGDVVVGGTTVQNKNNDRPVLDAFVFNYTTTPKLGKLSTFTLPVTAVIDTSQGSFQTASIGPLNMISTQLASALDAVDSSGGQLTINVTAKGHMSLSGAGLVSDSVNFPITLVNTRSATGACTTLRKGSGCSYPGQNQTIADQGPTNQAVCCDGMPTGPGCN